MQKPELFIQISVLEQHFKYWCTLDSMSSIEKVKDNTFLMLGKLNDLLFNSVNLIIDKDIAEYRENPFLMHLIKKAIQGSIKITHWENFNLEIIEDDRVLDFPYAIFIMDISDKESEEYSNKFGQLICNYTSFLSKLPFLIKTPPLSTTELNNLLCWENIFPDIQFNTLYIIDNYLLDKNEKLDKNIISFLQFVLKKATNCKLNITIVTHLEGRYLNSRSQSIRDEIKKFSNYNIKIINLKDTVKKHDRALITNYHYISSGTGFVFFNQYGKLNVETIIHFDGILEETIYSKINNKIKQVHEWEGGNTSLLIK
jgi:hypothetical protein